MFFQQLFQMMSQGVDLNLTVSRTETKITVLLMPRVTGLKDTAQDHIIPFTMTATPAEVDMAFFPAMSQPVQKTSGVLTNMAQYEKQADKAAANSKATRDQKDSETKKARENRTKYDQHIKKAEEQEKAEKFAEAIVSLQQARLHATDKDIKTVDDRIAALKSRMSQGSLFEIPPAEAPVQQAQPEAPEPQVQPGAAAQQTAQQAAPQPPQPGMEPNQYIDPQSGCTVGHEYLMGQPQGHQYYQPQQQVQYQQMPVGYPQGGYAQPVNPQQPVQGYPQQQPMQAAPVFNPGTEPGVAATQGVQ